MQAWIWGSLRNWLWLKLMNARLKLMYARLSFRKVGKMAKVMRPMNSMFSNW